MSDEEVLELIKEFVAARYQLTIATSQEHPWIANVYYAVDDQFNFYFLSNPETIHGKHIASNAQVAVSIADSPQEPSVKKKGVQFFGQAALLTEKEEISKAISLWCSVLHVNNENYSYEGMNANKIDGRMYKITPNKIKFFNQELWEEGNEPFIEL